MCETCLSLPDFCVFPYDEVFVFDLTSFSGGFTMSFTFTSEDGSMVTFGGGFDLYFEMDTTGTVGADECGEENDIMQIGCWACPTDPPTVYPTSTPSNQPSVGDDDNVDTTDDDDNADTDTAGDDGECCERWSLFDSVKNCFSFRIDSIQS